MDYMIMSGGDVAPLGEDAVNQLHSVFKWASRSSRGLLSFLRASPFKVSPTHYYLITFSYLVITVLSLSPHLLLNFSSHCHLLFTFSSPSHHLLNTFSSPSPHLLITISSPSHHRLLTFSPPSHHSHNSLATHPPPSGLLIFIDEAEAFLASRGNKRKRIN
jgi:hypothetical protein